MPQLPKRERLFYEFRMMGRTHVQHIFPVPLFRSQMVFTVGRMTGLTGGVIYPVYIMVGIELHDDTGSSSEQTVVKGQGSYLSLSFGKAGDAVSRLFEDVTADVEKRTGMRVEV